MTAWTLLKHEWRLLIRSRLALTALGILLALTAWAVGSGVTEVHRQRQVLAQLEQLQRMDMAVQQGRHADRGDAGSTAYYTFHGTSLPPSAAAFMALGMRDTAPYALRVRMLALQAQLHEGENFNPELALAGRFDFAFVLVFLVPLFLIALLHDLVSEERSSGRLSCLLALPAGGPALWLRRASLRVGLAFAALGIPLCVGALVDIALGSPMTATGLAVATALVATAAYVVFWTGMALMVAIRGRHSASNAMILMGVWAVMTLLLPALANAVITRVLPAHQGVELMLTQRQNVHAAWDVSREETLERFFESHPQWKNTAALPKGFHWKWYYAFQQLGDESVQTLVDQYRQSLMARQQWTERLGWLLPGVGVSAALHRLAGTDLLSQLAYQDAIAGFHRQLRHYYYPYLFEEKKFSASEFAAQPAFKALMNPPQVPSTSLLALVCIGLLTLWRGGCGIQGVRVQEK
jgi:ABC-2 type transport system permease protein